MLLRNQITFGKIKFMKKVLVLFAFMGLMGMQLFAQDSNTNTTTTVGTEKVMKCSEAEKAQCQKNAEKAGAKCETTDVKTEKSCGKAGNCSKGGSCCQKDGKASCSKDSKEAKGGSCCQKGGNASAGGSCCKKGGTAENTEKKAEDKK
jgi:hypothetical protein